VNKKKQCPFTKSPCVREQCGLWVKDYTRIVNLKAKTSAVKDTSACAFEKLGERAAMEVWNETEKMLDEEDDNG
jgi:hypothetical protein